MIKLFHGRKFSFVLLFASIFLLAAAPLSSSIEREGGKTVYSSDDSQVKIQRINNPVRLDGRIEESEWGSVTPMSVVTHQPEFGKEPSEKTVFLMAYDDDYLYVAAKCYERDVSKIQSTSLKRDDWKGNSDAFGIILDTFNDNENAVGFVTTPSAARIDFTVFDDGQGDLPVNLSWNTFWDSVTKVTNEGWFAEMRIPFSSLRFQSDNGDVVLSAIMYRYISRTPERIVFPAIPQQWGDWSFLKPSQAQEILLEKVAPKKPFYVTPYLLGGSTQSQELNSAGTQYERKNDPTAEAGLDIKYGLTNNLTMDITFNTDFAQVEADDEEVNLTRFSLYFPEKRLFFLERSSVFDFNLGGSNNLFYSRNIGLNNGELVRILGGTRVTGRIGKWDLGAIAMQTAKHKEIPSENFGVLRMRRQVFNPYSYIGGIATSRMGTDGSWNRSYGIDGIIRVFGDDYLTVKWGHTFDSESDNDFFSLDPMRIVAWYERRTIEGFAYDFSYSRAGNSYDPGLGFSPRDTYTRYGYRVQHGWLPGSESRLMRHLASVGGALYYNNDSNEPETSEVGPEWQFVTKNEWQGKFAVKHNYEDVPESFSFSDDTFIPTGDYSFYNVEAEIDTPGGSLYQLSSSIEAGSFYDGERVTLALEPSAIVGNKTELTLSYELNKLTFENRDQRFTSHIGRFKTLFMFSPALSMTAFVQYNSAADMVINNIRFRYNPREGNDLYLVYDEGYNTDRERMIPALPQSQNRTLLIKYSYTFSL